MMRKVPMLTIDQGGNPVLRGSTNIKVFIDDKPSDLYAPSVADALKQIPADDIVRIEVTLYPSAKYDAEGTDGVINIITKKTRFNAVKGTIRAQLGNRNKNFVPDLNIRNGKWIFNINSGFYYYQNLSGYTFQRQDFAGNSKNTLSQKSETDGDIITYYSGFSSLYVINDLHVINAGYRYRYNKSQNTKNNSNLYYQDDSLVTDFTRRSENLSDYALHTFNLGYNGKSRNRKQQYSLLAMYFSQTGVDQYDLDQVREKVTDYKENLRGNTSNNELSIQADYSNNLTDKTTWDAGFKSSFRQYDNTNAFEVFDFSSALFKNDQSRANQFNYRRSIYAFYSNYSLRFNNWQLRIGGRYEQTLLDVGFKDTALSIPDYKNFIPSLLLSNSFGKNQSLKWSYGKRITRPMSNINPAINYIDSFNLQQGNPDLQPEITNRYEMGYTRNGKQAFIAASLYYNSTHNGIEQVRIPLAGGVFLNTYQNIGKNDMLGLSFNITWKWRQKLTISSTTNLRYSWLKSEALQQSHNSYQASCNLNFSYNIGNGYSAEAYGNISSPEITLQGKRDVWRYYGVSINKSFKGDKLSVSLKSDNFLSSSKQYITQTWNSPTFSQQFTNYYYNFFCWFSVAWKFGKKEVKAPSVRTEPTSD